MTLPDWLADLRKQGADAYEQIAYPTGREEIWRFTDVSSINPQGFKPAADDAASVKLDGPEAPGVIFCDLETAITEHADLIKGRLGSLVGTTDPFTALSLGSHRGGTFLYVPKDVVIEAPFHALHTLNPGAAGSVVLPRTVVVIEDGAKVVFNDEYSSGDFSEGVLAAPVVEMYIGKGSSVGWVTYQDWGRGVKHVANVRAQLERDALLNTLVVTLGGDYSRTWKECTMAGEGAQSYMFGLYFCHDDQRFEHWTLQDHVAPHCTSDLLYKGALTGSSQAVYYGTINIREGAYRSDAYQKNANLALSDKARAMPHPRLEIENNDVRCTHGATVGQLSEEHLFYLESRGIPLEEARKLMVFGFFNQVLDKVTWSGMQDQLTDSIRAKMEV
ncbi:MAG: Fe-S cluster assembly protein SufD [Actinomycetota bacterium]